MKYHLAIPVIALALAAVPAAAQVQSTNAVSQEPLRPFQVLVPAAQTAPAKPSLAPARPQVAPARDGAGVDANTAVRPTAAEIEARRALVASTTAARLEALRATRAQRQETISSESALRLATFDEQVRARIIARAEHALGLLDAMVERLEGLSIRIEGRIELLAGNGLDTSAAQAELREANVAIDTAATAVERVKAAVRAALESEEPRAALQQTTSLTSTAKEALRAAHAALIEAVQALPTDDNQ